MFLSKKEKFKNQAKKIDRLVTGLIIWGAVASMIGLSRKSKRKIIAENIKIEWNKVLKEWTKIASISYFVFWKVIVCFLRIFDKKGKWKWKKD